jgi:prepilin-type N-terminal cleavage/methylation domain-containing protein
MLLYNDNKMQLTASFRRKMDRLTASRSSGFTVVELLIVIIVIAILAAIVIVAYVGVQDRAKTSQAVNGVEQYVRALDLYAYDHISYPIAATSGTIGCFDGTVNCNGSATQANSTALLTGVQQYMSNAPLAFPYNTTLLAYNTTADGSGSYTGYYILYSIPSSQTCPQNIAGTRFLNASTSGSIQACRMAVSPTSG